MRTAYLNILLFIALLAIFIGIQMWLYSSSTNIDFVNTTLLAKWLNIICIIPLVFTGGALFSSVAIKRPYLIIGLIVLAVLISSFQSDQFSFMFIVKLVVATTIGTLCATAIAKLLQYNSKCYIMKHKKKSIKNQ